MSDRYHSITLTLERDIQGESAETLIAACRAFRGVINVTPNVSDMADHIAQERARSELGQRLVEVLYPTKKETAR